MKKFSILIVVLFLVLALAGAVLAESPVPTPVPPEGGGGVVLAPDAALVSPQAFLHWLSAAAVPALGAGVALLARRSAWFQGLTKARKQAVALALGTGIPALAGALLLYVPDAVWVALQPLWGVIVPAIVGWVGMELTYLGVVRDRA